MSDFTILNGRVVHGATVSIDDRGFTLGDGLFETIPLYGGAPFLLERHLRRIRDAARVIKLRVPFTDGAVDDGIEELAGKNSVIRGVARLTLTRGEGARGYGTEGCDKPAWALTVRPYEPMTGEKWKKGVKVITARTRVNPHSPVCGLKTTSALERIMIFEEAREAGADEALALSTGGHIASLAAANIFWVTADCIHTPSLDCGVLPGVTRGTVMEMAKEAGIAVLEGKYTPEVLKGAREVFITNSLKEITPVTEVAGLFRAEKASPVTRKLFDQYSRLLPG